MNPQANGIETQPFQRDTLNAMFSKHYGASLRTAIRFLRSKEDAEDAVQTAYCNAFQRIHTFRGDSSFNTWITRIVMNCCLVQLRERRLRNQVTLDDLQRPPQSHAATPEKRCYMRELEAAHTRAASALPQSLKEVYAPCLIAGIAFPTVARHLGLTPAAAKSRLFRARRKVKHSLRPVIQRKAA